MAPVNYPCWMYHAERGGVRVENAEEYAGLGPGWCDSPGAADEYTAEPVDPPKQEDPPLRTDGPTLKEWLERGYAEDAYPPHGYVAREGE